MAISDTVLDIEELRSAFRGELVLPDHAEYESARSVWNGSIDRRPAVVARCSGPADVVAAVNFARERGLLVAVRGGAHNIAGFGSCDGGIVIDLSAMKGTRVDPTAETARVEGGAVWGDVDHETQAFGLAIPGGVMSTTGVAGFTLGGGIGWLMRKHALACDTLRSADVVTADGRTLVASEDENPDLFWGIRGGGGNFGVVTSFEFDLAPVGPTVLSGLVLHPLDRAADVLAFHRDFIAEAPDELTTIVILRVAPPAPFLPADVHGTPVIMVVGCYAGPVEAGEWVLDRLRRFGEPQADLYAPRPYVQFQSMFDGAWAPGFQNYWKAEYLRGFSDEAIEAIVDHARTITSPLSDMKIAHMQGAVSRVPEEATAFGHRDAPLLLNINTRWTDPAESDRHVEWTRGFWEAVQPASVGATYINFMGEEGEDRIRAAHGLNYDRLVELKDRYDPGNLFRVNQNIRPSV